MHVVDSAGRAIALVSATSGTETAARRKSASSPTGPSESLAAIPFGGKHETETGHLGSAVDTAAMPRTQLSRRDSRDDCIAGDMRKPNRATRTAVGALLLP